MPDPTFLRRVLPLLVLVSLLFPSPGLAEQTELSITSAFLTNVLDYIEWIDKKPEYVTICVAGDDIVLNALRDRIEEQKLSRSMAVRPVETSRSIGGCTALFIDHTAYQRGAALLINDAKNRQVLTVGNGPDFLSRGGIIQLEFTNRKLSFGINTKAAAKNRLRISGRLLGLAKQVY